MQIYSPNGSPHHSRERDTAEYIVRTLFARTIAAVNAFAQ